MTTLSSSPIMRHLGLSILLLFVALLGHTTNALKIGGVEITLSSLLLGDDNNVTPEE